MLYFEIHGTRIQKMARLEVENKLSAADKEREEFEILRMCFSLSGSVVPTVADDLPVLVSGEDLAASYKGPSHDIVGDSARIAREECERAVYIDPSKRVTRENVVKFHLSLGYDPYVFDGRLSDWDLPSNVLIQRVEYDTQVTTRRLVTFQFCLALLLFCMCCGSWVGQILDRIHFPSFYGGRQDSVIFE